MVGGGTDKGGGCGKTGKGHDQSEEPYTAAAQKRPDDEGHKVGAVHREIKKGGGGGAEVGEPEIYPQQGKSRDEGGTGNHSAAAVGVGIALALGAFEDKNTEHCRSQHIHGLISCLDPRSGYAFHCGGFGNWPDGVSHPHRNEDQKANEQGGGEDFSHDVHHSALPEADQSGESKEKDGKQHR